MMSIEYRGYTINETNDGFYECDGVRCKLEQLKNYIDGWIVDIRYERECESEESRRTEY